MKTINYLVFLLTSMVISLPALAQYTGPGSSYSSNNDSSINTSVYPLKTTTEAKRLSNNSYLSMEGNITRQVRKNDYTFQDNAGTITLTIGDDVTWPANISQDDNVRITGRVNRQRLSTTVVVFKIILDDRYGYNNSNYNNNGSYQSSDQTNQRLQILEQIINAIGN